MQACHMGDHAERPLRLGVLREVKRQMGGERGQRRPRQVTLIQI